MGPTLVLGGSGLFFPIFFHPVLLLPRERNLGKDTLARSILEGRGVRGAGLSSGTIHSLPVSASWGWQAELRRGGSGVYNRLGRCSSCLQALDGGLEEGVQRDCSLVMSG